MPIESGGMARTDEESIALIERGITGPLRHLRMRADGPEPVAHPVWIDRSEVLTSGSTGVFHPALKRGFTVAAGALIGSITDFHGRRIEEVRAPFAGEVLYVVGTPPISKGRGAGGVHRSGEAVGVRKRRGGAGCLAPRVTKCAR